MKITVDHSSKNFCSYRAERVKSLFNCADGYRFHAEAEIPVDDGQWSVGLIVGPSGSGKTSIGRAFFGGEAFHHGAAWPADKPIIEAIAPRAPFDDITAALSAVGLGSVPAWLRPFAALSNGEQFRAELARIICERPARIVIDEFTSVVDRQIARIGALAFGKAWRRGGGKAVLLSCHYDIIDWLEPDWVFDTGAGQFAGRGLWRRPTIELEIVQTNWSAWPYFEPHHYLKLPHMIAATNYLGLVGGEPVARVAVSPRFEIGDAMRACRLVILPEWQGAGVGVRFLNEICAMQARGENRYGRRCVTYFHTSHPQLAAALRRQPAWAQCSAVLYGGNRVKSAQSLRKLTRGRAGYGGHFRAVQGFKYMG